MFLHINNQSIFEYFHISVLHRYVFFSQTCVHTRAQVCGFFNAIPDSAAIFEHTF